MVRGKSLARDLAEAARASRLLSDYAAGEYAEERVRIAERHARKKKETNEHYLPLFEVQRKQYEAELVRIESEYVALAEKIGRQRVAEARAEEESYVSIRGKDGAPSGRRVSVGGGSFHGEDDRRGRGSRRGLGEDGLPLDGGDHEDRRYIRGIAKGR